MSVFLFRSFLLSIIKEEKKSVLLFSSPHFIVVMFTCDISCCECLFISCFVYFIVHRCIPDIRKWHNWCKSHKKEYYSEIACPSLLEYVSDY